MQKMLIFERKEMFYPPHIHKNRDESHIVLKGDLELFVLNNNGAVLKRIVNSIKIRKFQLCPQFCSFNKTLTDFVIYLEIKNGPHTSFQNDCFIPKPHNLKMMSNDDYDLYLDGFKNN